MNRVEACSIILSRLSWEPSTPSVDRLRIRNWTELKCVVSIDVGHNNRLFHES